MDRGWQTNDGGRRTICEDPDTDNPRKCRVVTEYRSAYPDPFVVKLREALTAGDRESEWRGWIWCTNRCGESRWVPEVYMRGRGEERIALRDYDATELTVRPGEEVITGEGVSGWIWCTNREGQSGWVPAEHLICSPAAENDE